MTGHERHLSPFKDITKKIITLVVFTITLAFTVNYFSPRGIPVFGEWDTSIGVISPEKNVDHGLEINYVVSAKKIFDSGKAVFVDARMSELYKEGHIKGAVSIPLTIFYDIIDDFISKYPTSTLIITYCSGRECQDSHELAQLLIDEGYEKVKVFIDGYPEWKKEGYPVE
ncbi:MAG: rhodanese-like domain-containing protein [Desulfobacteraceae bacterium]|nr:rhodanese-like domain-containing protein [Desulfobacteraceae bacterium]